MGDSLSYLDSLLGIHRSGFIKPVTKNPRASWAFFFFLSKVDDIQN